MDKLITRHRNLSILVLVLVAQVLGLAVQVKRPQDKGAHLLRVWALNVITPLEKGIIHAQDWMQDSWRTYFYLRDVRRENEQLQAENTRLRLEQVRMAQDASQAQRLQALLKFKEQLVSDTVAAQVIGSSGNEQSRVIYIDKGQHDGVKQDMAVITPTGIVGKVIRVLPTTAQVLEINDPSSGVGAILEKSRLQGILKGTPAGETFVHYVMNDEKVEVGEFVLTSGGDRIFPKGMPIGRVVQVDPGPDTFLNIRVKPAAQLERLEEVLLVTKVVDVQPELAPEGPKRASEILAERLPTVVPKPPEAAPGATPAPQPGAAAPATSATGTTKPGIASTTKPATGIAPKAGTAKPATATPASSVNPGASAAKPKTATNAGAATPTSATKPNAAAAKPKAAAPATIPGVQKPASASPAKVTPAAIPDEQKPKLAPKPVAENPTGGPGNEH